MVTRSICTIMLVAPLAACGAQSSSEPVTQEEAVTQVTPGPDQPVSILRPEVDQPGSEQSVITPLSIVIGFPDGGDTLDADAVGSLETLLQSEQLALGGPIIIRGHSDSVGSDRANLDASQERALAVAEWLIAQEVDPDRIDVIVFGEQNPVAANARPDGSPDEDGRAANRRVEIEIPTLDIIKPSESESVDSGN